MFWSLAGGNLASIYWFSQTFHNLTKSYTPRFIFLPWKFLHRVTTWSSSLGWVACSIQIPKEFKHQCSTLFHLKSHLLFRVCFYPDLIHQLFVLVPMFYFKNLCSKVDKWLLVSLIPIYYFVWPMTFLRKKEAINWWDTRTISANLIYGLLTCEAQEQIM